jgi:hypothetical protein
MLECVRISCAFGLSVLLLLGQFTSARAQERQWFLTGYAGQWANSDLLKIPHRAISGDLRFDATYVFGGAISRTLTPSFSISLPGTDAALSGNRLEVEAQVLRHFGDQRYWEGTLALFFRTGQIPLFGGLSVNLGIGDGISYASERPRIEHDINPRQVLNYLAIEAEFSHPALPGVHIVPRLHHRSGAYGLIAKNTGSNFIGIAIRADLN